MTRRDITTEMDAAAAEVAGENHTLVIRGEEFILPGGSWPWNVSVEVARFSRDQASPIKAVQAGAVTALDDAMKLAFGEEQYARVRALMRSADEFMVVVNAVSDLYTGTDVGESPGSSGNSNSNGELPKPISNGSTASTSDEPASEIIG